jgi:serine/threonine protein phosphatase PrpC
MNGFKEAEAIFMKQNQVQIRDKSGSCALVMLIIDEDVWIANTGDSRAVLSSHQGEKFESVTNDHKPSEEAEKKRIFKAGGSVYQNNNILLAGPGGPVTQGPVRVMPGRLSVSRTFGDCHAKMERLNGNPNVIIVDPEIHHFKIQDDIQDFVILGCDGVFDRMTTEHAC